jgi:hypothetical protein
MQVTNLRFEIAGLPINEYRINDGNLQMRALDPDGRTYPDGRSNWKRLVPGDIALHFRLHTVVGKWLEDRVCEWEDTQESTRAAQRDVRETTPIAA